jgi:D-alanyl-D-alanine carboxypeptidase
MAQPGRLGRRLLPLAFLLLVLATLVAARPAAALPIAPAQPASQPPKAYILVDANTGHILVAHDEHEPMLTASTVKLLTAIVALEKLPLDSTVPVSALAASRQPMKINMQGGQVWPFEEALRSLLMVSANDAAYAIAERTSGSIQQFAKDAQAEAKRLGATDTTFGDPAGLDDSTSYNGGTRMSAYDLAVVARNALAVPEIAIPARTVNWSFTDPTGATRYLTNHNKGFLTTYPGAIGLKTGNTKAANRTLVTAASRNGRTFIAIVLGTWDDTGWAGYLLDQGFTSPVNSPGTGASIPPVRVATADMRRQAFEGLPAALGRPALDGSARTLVTSPATRNAAARHVAASRAKTKDPAVTPERAAAPVTTAASDGAATSFVDRFVNIPTLVLLLLVVGITAFVLRRRSVNKQRVRRLAREQRMAEMTRRRMVDIVEPPESDTHVKVVPRHRRHFRRDAI